jgi:hypothetical protein
MAAVIPADPNGSDEIRTAATGGQVPVPPESKKVFISFSLSNEHSCQTLSTNPITCDGLQPTEIALTFGPCYLFHLHCL